MKKLLCAALAVLLGLAILGGCTKPETTGVTTTTGTTKESTTTVATTTADELLGVPGELPIVKKPFTIKLFSHQDISAIPSNDLLIYKTAGEYLGVTIEWETVPDADCTSVLTTRLAANVNLPDLICMYGIPMADIEQYGKNGTLVEITEEMLNQNAPGLVKFYAENADAKIGRTTVDGKMYSVPDSTFLRKEWQVNFMINQPWLEKLGLTAPKTTDELYNVLKAFKDGDPNGNGLADEIPLEHLWSTIDYMADSWDLHSLEGSHSGKYGFMPNEDGTVTCDLTDPRLLEYFTYMNKLYEEGLLDNEFSTNTMELVAANFKNNLVGAIAEWTSFSELYDASIVGDTYWKDGPVPYPVIHQPVADPKYTGNRFMRPSSGGNWSISSTAERSDVCLRFVDAILFNDKMFELHQWGIEGVTFEIDPATGKHKQTVTTEEFGKMGGAQWALPNRQGGWDDLTGPKVTSDKQFGRTSYIMDPFPVVPPTEAENEIINKYTEPVTTYFQEMRTKFIMGTVDLSKFDEYVQEIKTRGVDELIKVYQAQLDRYNALSK